LLNIIAGSLSVGVTPSTSSYESIATVTVGSGGSASISFSSIPSTYEHLQLRFIVRSAAAANSCAAFVRFNSDTSSNYFSYHEIFGDGSTAAAYAGAAGAQIQLDQFPAANRISGVFGVGVLDILDYKSTNKNKTTRLLSGYDSNGAGSAVFASGLWKPSTIAAINTITITENNGNNFAQYSSFALYGSKGS
jgi:hypothetical protein